MGLSIELMDCNQKVLGRVDDTTNFLHRAMPPMNEESRSLLTKVDWYGDSYFNYLQMNQFLREWSELSTPELKANEKALLEEVKKFALSAQRNRGILRFVGD